MKSGRILPSQWLWWPVEGGEWNFKSAEGAPRGVAARRSHFAIFFLSTNEIFRTPDFRIRHQNPMESFAQKPMRRNQGSFKKYYFLTIFFYSKSFFKLLKDFIVELVINISSDTARAEKENIYLQKLNMILVQILKQEWPNRWPTFISGNFDIFEANFIPKCDEI